MPTFSIKIEPRIVVLTSVIVFPIVDFTVYRFITEHTSCRLATAHQFSASRTCRTHVMRIETPVVKQVPGCVGIGKTASAQADERRVALLEDCSSHTGRILSEPGIACTHDRKIRETLLYFSRQSNQPAHTLQGMLVGHRSSWDGSVEGPCPMGNCHRIARRDVQQGAAFCDQAFDKNGRF